MNTIPRLLEIVPDWVMTVRQMSTLGRAAQQKLQQQEALMYEIMHITDASREDIAAAAFRGWSLSALRALVARTGKLPQEID